MSARMCPFFSLKLTKKMKRSLPYFLLMAMILLSACEPTKKRDGSDVFNHDDDDFPTAEEVIRDSIAEEKHISKESAVVCHNFEEIVTQLKNVNSPDALIIAKKAYAEALASLNNSSIHQEDKAVLDSYKKEAEEAYQKACREYEIPASGVLANLKNLHERIDQVKTKPEFYRFQDCRRGMLNGLDDIHLCVQHDSKQIPEIRRLAQSLKSKYLAKKQELDVK